MSGRGRQCARGGWCNQGGGTNIFVSRYPVGGDSVLEVDGVTREGAAETLWQLDGDGNTFIKYLFF